MLNALCEHIIFFYWEFKSFHVLPVTFYMLGDFFKDNFCLFWGAD